MDLLTRDVRHALRRLSDHPGFTAIAMITLALGVGATTAIYSVVDAMLLRPRPYKDPDALYQAFNLRQERQAIQSLSYDKLIEWQQQREIFASVEPFNPRTFTLTGGAEPRMVVGLEIGGGLTSSLGVAPLVGRPIQPDDAQPGRDRVVVLGEPLWRAAFGADPGVIGRAVRLDDVTFEIIGIMPRSFRFLNNMHEIWVPAPLLAQRAERPATYNALVRLQPGLSAAQAQTRIDAIAASLTAQAAHPDGWGIQLRPLGRMNPRERYALLVLFGAVTLVLLIACANLANLLLVQGAAREREIAVRAALGASRGRLVRQLLTETLLLAVAGGALGLVVASQMVALLAAYIPRSLTFLSANAITLDWRVTMFATALTLATAIASGLVPALRASRTTLHQSLKAGVRTSTDAPRQERIRRGFVIAQLALTLILLVGAGLLIRTFAGMTKVDPGFEADRLVTASLSLPRWKYATPASRLQYFDQVVERLRALPGVAGATTAMGAPPSSGGISFDLKFEIDGRGMVLHDRTLIMPIASVSPEYFAVLGIPLRAGRTFTKEDESGKTGSIVINETMARTLWKGDDPIGSRVRFDTDDPWYTVVGVVGDVYQFDATRPQGQFATYYPLGPARGGQMTLVARTSGDPADMVASIRREIWSVDPDQPILRIGTVRSQYSEFFDTPRFYALLMAAFAGIGLIIAAVGLYGVLAYAMAQRTREFGIRMALGAGRADVIRMVLRTGATLVAAGLLAGSAGSLLVTRSLQSMLVDVPRTDPVTYAAVVIALAIVGLSAAWIPARRATRIDPVVALRAD